MTRGTWTVMLVALAAISLGVVGQAISQDAGAGDAGGRGGRGAAGGDAAGAQRDPEAMRQRMEQFRQQMADRMKESLGASDEEWAVLQPKIEKVQTLSRDARGGGMRRRGGRPGADPAAADAAQPEQSKVQKAASDLRTVLDNKDATPDEITVALKALRTARAEAKAELEAAQKELREVLTVRQEAQLVSMGILD